MAATVVAPLLRQELSCWAVLDAPFKHKTTFLEWKHIIGVPELSTGDENDPFYNLAWELWMPIVRKAIGSWNSRNPVVLHGKDYHLFDQFMI